MDVPFIATTAFIPHLLVPATTWKLFTHPSVCDPSAHDVLARRKYVDAGAIIGRPPTTVRDVASTNSDYTWFPSG